MRVALRVAVRAMALVLLVAACYVGVTFLQVWRWSLRDEAQPAEAIVVLGAAQYDGEPSPVLQARLDHAADLYREGLAPVIAVTGGRRPGDRYSEATASASYLHGRGVPDRSIRREVSGATSYESIAATARFLRAEAINEVLLVSDPYHSYRIAAIAREVGLDGRVSPTPSSPLSGSAQLRHLARETGAVSVGRLVGYRRLTAVLERRLRGAAAEKEPPPPLAEARGSSRRRDGG